MAEGLSLAASSPLAAVPVSVVVAMHMAAVDEVASFFFAVKPIDLSLADARVAVDPFLADPSWWCPPRACRASLVPALSAYGFAAIRIARLSWPVLMTDAGASAGGDTDRSVSPH